MDKKEFNPALNAVVSIRHLAKGVTNKWSNMKTIGASLERELEAVSSVVDQFAANETLQAWKSEENKYQYNLSELKRILAGTVAKIKGRTATNLTKDWNSYHEFADGLSQNLANMQAVGKGVLPENKMTSWNEHWRRIHNSHAEIRNEAEACSLQLKLIEAYEPEEINELTATILKHIPLDYSLEEAGTYEQEYLQAYEAIKREASQKKNLWDRFLDLLAGGVQQTPAQRVMMQRWVNGEKGDNTL